MKILRAWLLPMVTIMTLALATSVGLAQAPIYRGNQAAQPIGIAQPTPMPPYVMQAQMMAQPPMGQPPMAPVPMGQPPMGPMPMGGMPMGPMPMGGMPMGPMPMGGMPMGAAPPVPTPMPMASSGGGMACDDMGYCPSCQGGGCQACGGCGFGNGGCGLGNGGCGPFGCGGLFGDLGLFGGCGYGCGALGSGLGLLLPYGDGGCCAPRWYDIQAEFVVMNREDVSRLVNFTSLGADPNNIVLDTDDLEFDTNYGFRIVGAYQVGPASSIELNFLGGFNFSDEAQVTDPNDALFSVFSEFGTNPNNGFLETDQADLHGIAYSSNFDSISLDYRRRWAGANCRIQGSWLMGVRYFNQEESLIHYTRVDRAGPVIAFMDYEVETDNNLVGFQVGGDTWFCIVPGLRFGGEGKIGIYNNLAKQFTSLTSTTVVNPYTEADETHSAAFVGEANMALTYRISHQTTLRLGYQFVYVDGLALATENFNGVPPNVFNNVPANRIRVPFLNTNGHSYYHGLTAGVEWMW